MNTIGNNIYNNIAAAQQTDVFGWNSYNPIFKDVIEKSTPSTIIEVGTWLGASALNMFKLTKEKNLNTRIFCVDTWLGAVEFWTHSSNTPERDLKCKNGYPQVYFDFLSNVVSHGAENNIIPIPNTSFIGSKILKYYNITAELIYVDGSHEYEDVKQDLTSYIDLLAPGGIIFGDDINWPGVNKAVKEFFNDKFEVIDNNFWVHQKK